MTAETRLIVELVDILAIRVECGRCGVAVSFKPADWKLAPGNCPNCQQTWGLPPVSGDSLPPIQHLGVGLRQLLEQMQAKGDAKLPFRLRLEVHQ